PSTTVRVSTLVSERIRTSATVALAGTCPVDSPIAVIYPTPSTYFSCGAGGQAAVLDTKVAQTAQSGFLRRRECPLVRILVRPNGRYSRVRMSPCGMSCRRMGCHASDHESKRANPPDRTMIDRSADGRNPADMPWIGSFPVRMHVRPAISVVP